MRRMHVLITCPQLHTFWQLPTSWVDPLAVSYRIHLDVNRHASIVVDSPSPYLGQMFRVSLAAA